MQSSWLDGPRTGSSQPLSTDPSRGQWRAMTRRCWPGDTGTGGSASLTLADWMDGANVTIPPPPHLPAGGGTGRRHGQRDTFMAEFGRTAAEDGSRTTAAGRKGTRDWLSWTRRKKLRQLRERISTSALSNQSRKHRTRVRPYVPWPPSIRDGPFQRKKSTKVVGGRQRRQRGIPPAIHEHDAG